MVEIFSRPLQKNTTRPLTVWIVGTDIEKGLPQGNPLSVVIPRWQPLQEQGEQLADQNTEGDLTKNF